jgi:ribonucleoside-diphosphate reductase alpha chain
VNEFSGAVKCRVYKTIKARKLWDLIMDSNYNFAEPGFILIDRYNAMNNNWFCEDIRATNPCGEQGLPPYGACLLGSINLTKFVVNPYSDNPSFDWSAFKTCVKNFTRMLDNVVELNGLPLEKQREEIMRKRRHGMGYYGLGSAMTMMGMVYGDDKSVEFTSDVTRCLAIMGLWTGVHLAREKGMAPVLQESFKVTGAMLNRNPQAALEGIKAGELVTGLELLCHSGYMLQIKNWDRDLWDHIRTHGLRFTHHSSIAPTGTLSLSFGNNCSNGIEPTFAHEYTRNVIREGRKTKEAIKVQSYELLVWEKETEGVIEFHGPTTDSISPSDHMRIQAAAQRWIDSSISKTVNVPSDISFEDFKDVYKMGYKLGCKGVATFRFNPEAFQGVLVKENDLENTLYRFTTEDGHVVTVKGHEQVWYDGALHTAANLHDALKEGTYGRF